MPRRVLVAEDGERIDIPDAFFEACSTLKGADFSAATSGAGPEAAGEIAPVEFPVPFLGSSIRLGTNAFDGLFSPTREEARSLLRLADFLGCPPLTLSVSRALEADWRAIFRGGRANTDLILEFLECGAYLPPPSLLPHQDWFCIANWDAPSVRRLVPALRRAHASCDPDTPCSYFLESSLDLYKLES